MATIKITKLQELENQLATVQEAYEEELAKEKSNAIAQVLDLVKRFKLEPADLGLSAYRASETKTKRAAAKPKYKIPNSTNTWTGRGKPPKAIADYEANGGKRANLLIG